MTKLKTGMTVAALGLAAAWTLTGCSASAETEPTTDEPTPPTTTQAPVEDATATLVDFTNAEGQTICPVAGDVISDKSKAVGHEDYNGKTYYFCCGGCPEAFHANPAKYEDGKGLTAKNEPADKDHS